MVNKRKAQPFHIQIWDIFLIEMTNWRWSWRSVVIVGAVAPLLSMLALSVFARDMGTEALSYVLTGNIVLSLMFGLQNNIEGHLVFMKTNGALAYFASLPIRKSALVLAITLAFFLLNLPAVLLTMLVGGVIVGIPLAPSWLILLVVPICALPMAGVGALIGAWARTPQEGGSVNLLVTFLMTGLGPVIIPPDRLPDFMLTLSKISPATYAASAMRQTLLGPVTQQLWLDLAALLLFTVVIFFFVNRRLDWREA